MANTARRKVGALLRKLERRGPLAARGVDSVRSARAGGADGRAVPVPPTPPVRPSSPIERYQTLLPSRRRRKVVVLAPDGLGPGLLPWLTTFHADHVHVLSPRSEWAEALPTVTHHEVADVGGAHEVIKVLGRIDVLVDLAGGTRVDYDERWRALFLHLRHGGAYVIGRPDGTRIDRSVRAWAAAAMAGAGEDNGPAPRRDPDVESADPEAAAEPVPAGRVDEFSEATSEVLVTPELVIIGKRLRHLLKLRHAETSELVTVRDRAMGVTDLVVLPAGSFESRARVTHHLSDAGLDWPDPVIEYPAANLRHYEGPVTFGTHGLLYTPSSILPDAFRWHLYRDPSNPRTINASTNFARIPPEAKASKVLTGHYYPLDPGHPGFGHVMTETVSRLWGWDRAKAEIPELKAILQVGRRRGPRVNQVKYRVLRAYGIPADDIVWTKKTVQLDSVVSATAMWHNNRPYYVHPDLRATWHRLGERLVDPEAPTYDKIFVARSARYGRRSCRNAEQVETLFAANGFTIYYPENFDLAEQAAVFSAARVIAGYGGSGLFNILFARRLETTIILNQDAYYHRNEHLFTSVLGGDVHYYWSEADLPQDGSGRDEAASRSGWEFDVDRHGADLADLLRSL